ncbi:Piwi-domain-containing protein [Rickenella mellea]|uniref:Piwi-domain-containing protein n=1 Tax=Rickenella mellea TaxID=50990 RepID=A0A4Y7Q3V8_9AGAM|nr:Piwi-domain-containing protein [Rickenella mellea]
MSNIQRGTRGGGRGRGQGRGGGRGGRGNASSSGASGPRGAPRGRGGPPGLFTPVNASTTLEPRLSAREQDALISSFNSLTTAEGRPVRPGFGKLGTAIKVRANFFAVKYPKNTILYDYTVNITPKTDVGRLKKRIFELLEGSVDLAPFLHDIAHDRSQRVVSRRKLPDPFVINVPFYEDGEGQPRPGARVYEVEICDPRELNSKDLDRYLAGDPAFVNWDVQPIISAFNLITSQHAAKQGVICGKNRYFFPDQTFPLSLGVEAWKGYYSSVRPAYKQLMVNVNVCMSAFYVPTSKLSDAIMEFQRRSQGAVPAFFVGKVKVSTSHLGYRMKKPIKAIENTPATQKFFDCAELGGRVSVAQYFERKYKIKLQHGKDLPLINIGNKTKDNFVPAELCEIEPGQAFRGVLDERATAEMIKYACNPPAVNATAITQDGLGKLGFPQQATPMEGFGVSISTEMTVVPARVLPPPSVEYKSGPARVADGSWNILGVKFSVGARFGKSNCAILVVPDGGRDDFTGPQDPSLKAVVTGFLDKCRNSGMVVENELPNLRFTKPLPKLTPQDPFRTAAIEEIQTTVRSLPTRPQLLLVFLSNQDRNVYPGLKRLFDVQMGIHSVCMLMSKVKNPKGQDQYFSNNALKVNAKLGGINHKLQSSSIKSLSKTMLVGMDVTHPGANTVKGTPSIAGVVASCDDQFTQYPASLRIQESRVEMIQEVKEMMTERLKEYQERMKGLPQKILIYRDGVSEGQFDIVRTQELPQIQRAIASFANYRPKLTIIICGKRHHARFYPTEQTAMDRTGNNKAGTVVDSGVTAVYDFDFYLQAHAGLQGTTRPTHYTVVHDENKMTADELQQLTNHISYLWARATKSVSLIPPAYWADQVCERGRCYLHQILPPTPGSRESKMSEEQIWRRAEELWGNGIHTNLCKTMFYL